MHVARFIQRADYIYNYVASNKSLNERNKLEGGEAYVRAYERTGAHACVCQNASYWKVVRCVFVYLAVGRVCLIKIMQV